MRSLHPSLRTLIVALAAVALLWQSPVTAQMTGGNGSKEAIRSGNRNRNRGLRHPISSMIVRVYEVTDLVAHVPDYEYSQATQKSMGGGSLGGRYGGGIGMLGMGNAGMAGMGGMGGMMPAQPGMANLGTASPPGISIERSCHCDYQDLR